MNLLTPRLTAALAHNYALGCIEREDNEPRHDPLPLVKFFNPCGAATWIATEIAEDGDALFGLADLGFGCPELGYFSLWEIEAVRLPFGLRIERDLQFRTDRPLSVWADMARLTGSIINAERALRSGSYQLSSRKDG